MVTMVDAKTKYSRMLESSLGSALFRSMATTGPWMRLIPALLVLTAAAGVFGEPAAEAAGPQCVSDDLSRRVCITSPPERVVSLAPSMTEMVFAMGAGTVLVGRTERCNRPAEARKVGIVGAYMRPDLERVIAARPDLVLTTSRSARKEFVYRLEELGMPVFVSNSGDLDDISSLVTRLGKLLSRTEAARTIVEAFERDRRIISELVIKRREPTVLLVVGMHPLVVAGGKSFVGSLIREAGGLNIAESASSAYPKLSMEEVIRKDPDLILFFNKECPDEQTFLQRWSRFPSLRAVRHRRVHALDADLMARPTPDIARGLAQLVRIFNPGTAASLRK